MYKLGTLVDGQDVRHVHPPVYEIERMGTGGNRLVVTAPSSDPAVFKRLADCLEPPYYLLFVLLLPCGDSAAEGRYQSPLLQPDGVHDFLRRFGHLFQSDGRFALWAISPADQAQIVWDQHDLLFGYGATGEFERALQSLAFELGQPTIPSPHTHCYHRQLDDDVVALLSSMDWSHSPLRDGDDY